MTQSFFALWTKSHCVVKHNDLWHALFCDYLHKNENFNHYLRLIGHAFLPFVAILVIYYNYALLHFIVTKTPFTIVL